MNADFRLTAFVILIGVYRRLNLSRLFQSIREAACPTELTCGIGDFVLAKLDLKVWHISAHGVKRDGVIDRWIQIVRLIIADCDIALTPQIIEHRLREGSVSMAGDCDLPGADVPGKARRHGMDGEGELALLDDGLDRCVVRFEPLVDTRLPVYRGQIAISWNERAVADFWNQVRGVQLAIAIDHQA